MKIIQLPALFFPDRGGSETYVLSLSKQLQRLSVDVLVVAPGAATSEYVHEGVRVRRFPWGRVDEADVRQSYAGSAPHAVDAVIGFLAAERPDVVHVHGHTHEISTPVLDAIKNCGVPIVFTYHTPAITCLHTDLLRHGREHCDGEVQVSRCATCNLQRLGVPDIAASLLGHVPAAVGPMIAALGLRGRLGTALRMTECVTAFRDDIRQFLARFDRVILLSEWSRQLVLRNGVPADRTVLSRLGLSQDVSAHPPASRPTRPGAIRVAFLGRYDPLKGLHVIVEAIRSAPDLPVALDVFSVALAGTSSDYYERIKTRIGDDARVTLCPPIPDGDVVRRLAEYDALVVPSQWFETGPFVVFEAFAAGIPVIGSNLGGIAELVRHGKDGLLVDAGSVAAWTAALRQASTDPACLETLRQGIRPQRTMRDVAQDAVVTYRGVAGVAASIGAQVAFSAQERKPS